VDLFSTFSADASASKGATYGGTLFLLQLCEFRIFDIRRGEALLDALDIFLRPSGRGQLARMWLGKEQQRGTNRASKLTAASYISIAAMILSLVSISVPIISSFSTS